MRQSYSKTSALPAKFIPILRLLDGGKSVAPDQMAKALEVDRRSVRRYLAKMRAEHGLSIAYDGSARGYRLEGAAPAIPSQFHFSAQEAQALAVAAATLRGLLVATEGHMAEQLDGLVGRLAAFLEPESPVRAARVRDAACCVDVVASPMPLRGDAWLGDLLDAIAGEARVRMTYRKPEGDPYEVVIEPYHLRHATDAWYVVARDAKARAYKVYSLARIEALASMGEAFVRRKDFDPQTYFAGVLGVSPSGGPLRPFAVRLTGFAALRVRECVLPKGFTLKGEVKRGKKTGAVLLEGKLENTRDLVPWVNGWGEEAAWVKGG